VLFGTYPNATLERKHIDAYMSAIVDLPADAGSKAVDRLRRTKTFLPSVAEIRSAAADVQLGPQRTGEDAYRIVLEAIRKFGRYAEPRFSDPHITRALGVWGSWVGACNSPEDDPGGRARFIELYESCAGRERLDVVSGIPLPAPRVGSEYLLPERASKRARP
jgi:hypothetical protein